MAQKNQSWDDLGQTIERIVDRAVNAHDFESLNRTVTQTLEKALDLGGKTIQKVADAGLRMKEKKTPTVVEAKPDPVRIYGKSDRKTVAGILKIVGGSLLTVTALGVSLVSILISAILSAGGLSGGAWILGLLGCGGGLALIGNGIGNVEYAKRFKAYCHVLGDRTCCTLESLARKVGKKEKFVRKEVQAMIRDGLFLEGHLDQEQTRLITTHETYRLFEENRLLLQQRQQREAEEKARREAAAPNAQVLEVLERGDAFLAQIRRCNDAIAGFEISQKISRIEDIVERIFDRAESHPEIIPDLKKTMDYYLPMTVKLLSAYADMDNQPVQSEAIRNAKKEIEDTLDTLNLAYEKLMDSIFADTVLDISSDISVLNTMLVQDGLADDGLKL